MNVTVIIHVQINCPTIRCNLSAIEDAQWMWLSNKDCAEQVKIVFGLEFKKVMHIVDKLRVICL